ncbi:hypothetical protein [Aquimarina longa]|uniref:hypothetical protein n=1 Tax=Aquimarina longa TaxID=1080221 RepID=UPI00078340CD|nr:hypothetical protein [Aquimarina longa]
MPTIVYNQLSTAEQTLASHKIAVRTKAPQEFIHTLLITMNPYIKIVGKEVILFYGTLMRIEEYVRGEFGSG